jgi:hypothetical protein
VATGLLTDNREARIAFAGAETRLIWKQPGDTASERRNHGKHPFFIHLCYEFAAFRPAHATNYTPVTSGTGPRGPHVSSR